jgi:GNAT superfamily N-acetyltransferase
MHSIPEISRALAIVANYSHSTLPTDLDWQSVLKKQQQQDREIACAAQSAQTLEDLPGWMLDILQPARTASYRFYSPNQPRNRYGRWTPTGASRHGGGQHTTSVRHPAQHGASGGHGGSGEGGVTVEYLGKHGMARMHEVFGRTLSHQELASITGAQPGAHLRIVGHPEYSLVTIEVQGHRLPSGHAAYSMMRTFSHDFKGRLAAENNSFKVDPSLQRSGLGTRIFASQVAGLRALGVERLSTLAARNHEANGYYTWARLGYNMRLSGDLRQQLHEHFGDKGPGRAAQMTDLMRSKAGRDWWREHGHTWLGEFDLRDGSASMRMLQKYLKHRQIGDIRLSEPQPSDPSLPLAGDFEEIPWTEEDEAAADAAMDEMNTEDGYEEDDDE